MSRDQRLPSPRGGARVRTAPRAPSSLPDAPEASFWLERTPLPILHRPATRPAGKPGGRSALAPPGTVCPKCDSPLSTSEPACPSCGLKRAMFGRFRTGAMDRVPATLEEQWAEVEANWGDPDRHERFLAQVSLCAAYAYAASRYRRAARERRSDAISKLQLERLSRMVHAVMAVSSVRQAGEDRPHPYRRMIVLLALLIGLGSIGGVYLFHRRSASADQRPEPLAPSIKIGRGRSLGTDGRAAPAFGGLRAKVPKPAPADGEDGEAGEAGEGEAGEAGEGEAAEGERTTAEAGQEKDDAVQ